MSRDKQISEMAKEICSEYDCVIPCQSCAYYGYANCRDVKSAEKLYNAGYRKSSDVVPKSEVDDLKRYIILNEDIAIKCKRENGEQNEEYWRGKISAFRQIRSYIDAELKKKYTEDT